MTQDKIKIVKAATHNLKDVSLEIPKHKLVVFTGVSGSGKSSLVFDTIYTEAQRQLIETFSTFARARMAKLSRPDVEDILNLSTSIVIDQKRMGSNMRSTVGTATEIITYLRLLYSRFAEPQIEPSFLFSYNHPEGMCPHCHGLGQQMSIDLDLFLDKEKSLHEGAITHPDYKVDGWQWAELVALNLFDPYKKLKDYSKEELQKLLYSESMPIDKKHGAGTYRKNFMGLIRKMERNLTLKAESEVSGKEKNAYQRFYIYTQCRHCGGSRLNERARSAKINGVSLDQLCNWELTDMNEFLKTIEEKKAQSLILKVQYILTHLIEVGVGYLTLNRNVGTLSGGESQRVKMARQLDCTLTDLIYIMDEPSTGLHPRDTDKMLNILRNLKDKGNTLFVVEHDPDIIKQAEWIVDIGPRAGVHGGEIVYNGPIEELDKSSGLTKNYLFKSHQKQIERKAIGEFLEIKGASLHNLKDIDVQIPKGVLTCVTGVSGSGKSSLIHGCFLKEYPQSILIDQSPVGKTSRSNPATYMGFFDSIRKIYAKETGEKASLFSFNSKGACEKCKGSGFTTLELSFLDAVRTVCDQCNGSRYKGEILDFRYKEKSIADVLDMTVSDALEFFTQNDTQRKLQVMNDVGLSYLKIGQPLSTLSGGETQRLKIASELHKSGNVYVMDEPTTGLHMADIDRLFTIVKNLTDKGNTVIIIEHNLDIIKQADWIIDMGPEGGNGGGEVLFQGLPEDLIMEKRSYTGQYLKEYIDQ